jgi:sulfoxide reductase catalytic subunit YedY
MRKEQPHEHHPSQSVEPARTAGDARSTYFSTGADFSPVLRRHIGTGAAIAEEAKPDPRLAAYPAAVNPAFSVMPGVPFTAEEDNTAFNNFYEFGASKRIASLAQKLETTPWAMMIDGEVEKPITIDFDDLMKKVSLEMRVVRHRCVEAWAMVVPWTGFPLSQLVKLAKPTQDARYVRFETFYRPNDGAGPEVQPVW